MSTAIHLNLEGVATEINIEPEMLEGRSAAEARLLKRRIARG